MKIEPRDAFKISPIYAKLMMHKQKATQARLADTLRVQPYALFLASAPGCGKTDVVQALIHAINISNGYPQEGSQYHRNKSDKFISDYDPSKIHFVMDEVASQASCLGLPDESINQLLQIISPAPYIIPDAIAERKGTIPFLSKTVFAMGNTEDMNARYQLASPSALMRRWNVVVRPSVLPEFRKPDSVEADGAKVMAAGKGVCYQQFELVKYVATDGPVPKCVPIETGLNLNDLCRYVVADYKKHMRITISYVRNFRRVGPYCPSCTMPLAYPGHERCEQPIPDINELTEPLPTPEGPNPDLVSASDDGAGTVTQDGPATSLVYLASRMTTLGAVGSVAASLLYNGELSYRERFSCLFLPFRVSYHAFRGSYDQLRQIANAAQASGGQAPGRVKSAFGACRRTKGLLAAKADEFEEHMMVQYEIDVKERLKLAGKVVAGGVVLYSIIAAVRMAMAKFSKQVEELKVQMDDSSKIEEDTPDVISSGRSEFVVQPHVTPVSKRWEGATSSGFVRPDFLYDPKLASTSFEDLSKAIGGHLIAIGVRRLKGAVLTKQSINDKQSCCVALPVGGTHLLTAFHPFFGEKPDDNFVVSCVRARSPGLGPRSAHWINRASHIRRIGNLDACIVDLGSGLPLPDLRKFFIRGKWLDPIGAQCAVMVADIKEEEAEKLIWLEARGIPVKPKVGQPVNPTLPDGSRINTQSEVLTYPMDSKTGYSGAPLLFSAKSGDGKPIQTFVWGIHFCGTVGRDGHALPISRDQIDQTIKLFDGPSLSAGECVTQGRLSDVSDRSFLNNVAHGSCVPMGSMSIPPQGKDTSVYRTTMHPFVDEMRYPDKWEPPIVHGRLVDDQWIDPMLVNLRPILELPRAQPEKAEAAMRVYRQYAKTRLNEMKYQGEGFGCLGVKEAINGIPGADYIDPLKFTTSGGFGFQGPKSAFFTGDPGHREMVPRLQEEYDRIVECYKKKERSYPVFMGTFKQEPQLRTKNAKGGVRVFGASPLAFNILFRQFYLPVIRFIMLNRHSFGISVGMNCMSTEWKTLYDGLNLFGAGKVIAGDYSKYDKTMRSEWILRAFRMMIEWARDYGKYSAASLRWMEYIAQETTYHVLCVKGDFLMMQDSNPSGQSATVIINSIVNLMYLSWVALRVKGLDSIPSESEAKSIGEYLHNNTHASVYGDDNIISSNDPALNQRSMENYLKEIGQIYTTADKKQATSDFIGTDTATFLKRGFRYDVETGIMMAPLVEETIARMLHWAVKSTLTLEMQSAAILQDAGEQYWMYGRTVYEERTRAFELLAERAGLNHHVSYPSFDALTKRYNDSEMTLLASSCEVSADDPLAIREIGLESLIQVMQGAPPAAPPVDDSRLNVVQSREEPSWVLESMPTTYIRLTSTPSQTSGAGSATNEVPQMEVDARVEMSTTDLQQTVTFEDNSSVEKADVGETGNSVLVAPNSNPVGLAQFLERPVRYDYGEWTTGIGEILDINPWQAFLTNPAVMNKLQNFQYIRGTLHARLVVNGSPFHYGLISLSYHPFKDDVSVEMGNRLTRAVQLPHVFLNPSGGGSVELSMPFVNQRNFINLSQTGWAGEYQRSTGFNMGRLILKEFVPLALANQAGATEVEYSLFLWMTDVDLQVSTPYPLVTQAGDEYIGEGVISKPASTVARWANWLSDVPVIGRFARATEIGANAVSGIASIFGFSKPLMLEDLRHFKPRLFGPFAITEGRDNAYKLTLDPKNEVSIDPSIIGLPAKDSMAFANIISREGLIGDFDWLGEHISGHQLARYPVSPSVCPVRIGGGTGVANTAYDMTPLGFTSMPFRQWTGGLRYRIQFVASPYHRGRIRVTYFPHEAQILPAVDYTNLAHNIIVDLSETRDISFVVNWAQANPWGGTTIYTGDVTDPNEWDGDAGVGNGELVIQVLNQLRAPLNPSSVRMIVTVCAADDFALSLPEMERMQLFVVDGAAPRANFPDDEFNFDVNTYTRTAGEPVVQMDEQKPLSLVGDDLIELVPALGNSHSKSITNIGEQIASVRSLVKRSYPIAFLRDDVTNGRYTSWNCFLPSRVWDFQANNQGLSPAPTVSMAVQNPLTWFAPAFACQRGGLRWRLCESAVNGLGGTQSHTYDTDPKITYAHLAYADPINMGTNATTVWPVNLSSSLFWRGGNGVELWNSHIMPGIECEVPYYYPLNFKLPAAFATNAVYTSGSRLTTGNATEVKLQMRIDTGGGVSTQERRAVLRLYVSAAEDYTLDWFVCVPTMYGTAQRV